MNKLNTTQKHEDAAKAIKHVLLSYDLKPVEMLALLSSVLGQALLFQDPKFSHNYYLDLILNNVTNGHKNAVDQLHQLIPKPAGNA